LLVKMVLNNLTNQQVKMNYGHLCDLQILLGLIACILFLLEFMHILIKFAHMKDVFVCNLCGCYQGLPSDLHKMYCKHTFNFMGCQVIIWVQACTCDRYLILILDFNIWPLK
jgi:hypothetical protein